MEVKKFESDQWIYCQNVFLSRFLPTLFLPNRRSKIIILIQICSISIWKHLFTLWTTFQSKDDIQKEDETQTFTVFVLHFCTDHPEKNDRQHNLHSACVFYFFLPKNNFLPLKIDDSWKNLKKLILHFFKNFCFVFFADKWKTLLFLSFLCCKRK